MYNPVFNSKEAYLLEATRRHASSFRQSLAYIAISVAADFSVATAYTTERLGDTAIPVYLLGGVGLAWMNVFTARREFACLKTSVPGYIRGRKLLKEERKASEEHIPLDPAELVHGDNLAIRHDTLK